MELSNQIVMPIKFCWEGISWIHPYSKRKIEIEETSQGIDSEMTIGMMDMDWESEPKMKETNLLEKMSHEDFGKNKALDTNLNNDRDPTQLEIKELWYVYWIIKL